MLRNIFKVDCVHVVVSDNHPEGAYSTVTGFPILVDSRNYNASEQNPNGDSDVALIVAKAEFADQVKTLTIANNPNRKMWAVTLSQANGVVIDKKSYGAFPDMTPIPPEPEPEPEEEPEENQEPEPESSPEPGEE